METITAVVTMSTVIAKYSPIPSNANGSLMSAGASCAATFEHPSQSDSIDCTRSPVELPITESNGIERLRPITSVRSFPRSTIRNLSSRTG